MVVLFHHICIVITAIIMLGLKLTQHEPLCVNLLPTAVLFSPIQSMLGPVLGLFILVSLLHSHHK